MEGPGSPRKAARISLESSPRGSNGEIVAALCTVGRMNPITSGHALLLSTLMFEALKSKTHNIVVILSATQDEIENPLPGLDKQTALQEIFDNLKDKMKFLGYPEEDINLLNLNVQLFGSGHGVLPVSGRRAFIDCGLTECDASSSKICLFLGEDKLKPGEQTTSICKALSSVAGKFGLSLDEQLLSRTAKIDHDESSFTRKMIFVMNSSAVQYLTENHASPQDIEEFLRVCDPVEMSGTKLRSFALTSKIFENAGDIENASKYRLRFMAVLHSIGVREEMANSFFDAIIANIKNPTDKCRAMIERYLMEAGIPEEVIQQELGVLFTMGTKTVGKAASTTTTRKGRGTGKGKGGSRRRSTRRIKRRSTRRVKKGAKRTRKTNRRR